MHKNGWFWQDFTEHMSYLANRTTTHSQFFFAERHKTKQKKAAKMIIMVSRYCKGTKKQNEEVEAHEANDK